MVTQAEAPLKKSQVVLYHLGTSRSTITFQSEQHSISMPRQDWVDMGSPDTLTVTIKPGFVVD